MSLGLLRKLAVPILACAALFSPLQAKAEESPWDKAAGNVRFSLSGGLGVYIPVSEPMQDIYGPMIKSELGANLDLGGLRFGADFSLMSKKGNPYKYSWGDIDLSDFSAESKLTILEADIFSGWLIPLNPKLRLYLNGGSDFMSLSETLTVNYSGTSYTDDWNSTAFGFYAAAGLEFAIDKNKISYLEASARSAKITGYLGEVDAGGFTLEAGARLYL